MDSTSRFTEQEISDERAVLDGSLASCASFLDELWQQPARLRGNPVLSKSALDQHAYGVYTEALAWVTERLDEMGRYQAVAEARIEAHDAQSHDTVRRMAEGRQEQPW